MKERERHLSDSCLQTCWSRQITMKVDVIGTFSQHCGFHQLYLYAQLFQVSVCLCSCVLSSGDFFFSYLLCYPYYGTFLSTWSLIIQEVLLFRFSYFIVKFTDKCVENIEDLMRIKYTIYDYFTSSYMTLSVCLILILHNKYII